MDAGFQAKAHQSARKVRLPLYRIGLDTSVVREGLVLPNGAADPYYVRALVVSRGKSVAIVYRGGPDLQQVLLVTDAMLRR
jgi:hypothetical protein